MSACFDMENTLPVSLAHAMVAVVCNLKLWLNYGSVIQLFIPLRSRVMKYMCRLGDKELRTPAVRTMAGTLLKLRHADELAFIRHCVYERETIRIRKV